MSLITRPLHAGAASRTASSGVSLLTSRQVQVLKVAAEGSTNQMIARRLHVSPSTVKRHLEDIYVRLGVSSRTAAAVYATRHRLL